MHSRFMLAGLCSISTTFDGVIGPAIEGGAERGGIGLSHTTNYPTKHPQLHMLDRTLLVMGNS
ncbi:hypothetical protein PGT21_030000 [Puccinia graminis f. sp. tritici]|uniref:Uncharacterized protein n=1 Tax=Puccinia graminis f. sp. tritici TaxID=56615 RepID=A0A5B0QQ77_PUCGR|nr:hypothetical protein PGT21_030000 [Puccinia graminis f. sp. tritici]